MFVHDCFSVTGRGVQLNTGAWHVVCAIAPLWISTTRTNQIARDLMHSDSGHTTSVWMDTTEVPQFQPLTQDMRVNVCIVGAGIAGLTTAYLLARAGRAVVVIDDGPIGGGETGRTTAHL